MFAAIPFAIWFFLAIEGVAMAAEEAKDPKRSIPIAYIAGILTLVVLAIGVMVFAGGAQATGPNCRTSTTRCRRR
jgi:ethanolamine permease